MQIIHQDKSAKTYQKAYQYFERALTIDSEDPQSLYYMGLMNLLGLGRD